MARGFRKWKAGPGVGQLVWPEAGTKIFGPPFEMDLKHATEMYKSIDI